MAVAAVKTNDFQQTIKKVLVLEWRQEEEISENEARKLIHNFSNKKKVCQKHSSMVTSSIKDENDKKHQKSFIVSPVLSKKKKVIKNIKTKSKSTKGSSKKLESKKSKSKKTSSKCSKSQSFTKEVSIKDTSTNIKIDKNSNVVTKQKIKIPYKLYWRPTVTETGKEGITFKIQVQDLEGRKMELDVSCPGFIPHKVRLNGVNLKKI